jgi:hypothetical protein
MLVPTSTVPTQFKCAKEILRYPEGRKSRTVPWTGLHSQMGAEYNEIRIFKAKVLLALKKI